MVREGKIKRCKAVDPNTTVNVQLERQCMFFPLKS